MQAFFGLLSFLAICAMVVALIKPGWILPIQKTSRLKAFGAAFLALVVITVVGIQLDPVEVVARGPAVAVAEAPAPVEHTPAPEPEEVVAQPRRGLGLTLLSASLIFRDLGIELERGAPIDGMENWVGNQGPTTIQVVGPPKDIQSIGVMAAFDGNDQNTVLNAGRMAAVLRELFPEWDDALDWVAEATSAGGGNTVRDGRQVSVSVAKEIGMVSLTVEPEG